MASDVAQEKHFGGKAAYRAAEGKAVSVPYRGNVEDTILAIKGGLRSMMTYIGAYTLVEVQGKTEFVKAGAQLNAVFGD
jgi:GMP reductase